MLDGIEAIRGRIRTALQHLDDSQHLVGNHEIAVDGDAATHRCYLQAQHVREAAVGGPNYIVAGRYEDRLARTDAGWRITHRTLTVMWTDGNVGRRPSRLSGLDDGNRPTWSILGPLALIGAAAHL